MTTKAFSSTSFSRLPLEPEFLVNLQSMDYQVMTPIQEQSLADILKGKDLLAQAKTGREHILDIMYDSIPEVQEMSEYAPKILSVQIAPEKIGGLIGPGGKTIKKIIADTECDVNVDDKGSFKCNLEFNVIQN